MLTAPKDVIIVQIAKKTKDEITIAGGLKLWVETRLNMEEHATLNGTVISIPPYLKRDDLLNIDPQVRVDDDLYFNYSAIYDQTLVGDLAYHNNLLQHNGKDYWLIDYSTVLFSKRGDDIVMHAGNVLVEPYKTQENKSSFLSLPDFQTKTARDDKGTVVAIGNKLFDKAETGVVAGDIISFDKKYRQRYEFFNKTYFIIKQDRILAKYAD